MLITTDMKVSDLLRQHNKAFLNAAYASPQLYPLTHDGEVLAETFSLFAAIHPAGTLADLLDFMQGSCESEQARVEAFKQLETRVGAAKKQQQAQALFGFDPQLYLTDHDTVATLPGDTVEFHADPVVLDALEAPQPVPGIIERLPMTSSPSLQPVVKMPAPIPTDGDEAPVAAVLITKPSNPFATLARKVVK